MKGASSSHAEVIPEVDAWARLVELLGAEKLERLAELVEEVTGETGYGNVTIIVSQGRVARLKAEKSY